MKSVFAFSIGIPILLTACKSSATVNHQQAYEQSLIDGQVVMNDRRLLTLDEQKVIEQANAEAADLMVRAGLN